MPEERDKRPRHYAAEILALPTRVDRAAALAAVPDIYREWVRFYVNDYFERRKFLQRAGRWGAYQARRAPRRTQEAAA